MRWKTWVQHRDSSRLIEMKNKPEQAIAGFLTLNRVQQMKLVCLIQDRLLQMPRELKKKLKFNTASRCVWPKPEAGSNSGWKGDVSQHLHQVARILIKPNILIAGLIPGRIVPATLRYSSNKALITGGFSFVFFLSAAPVSSTGRAQRASSLSVEGAAKYQRCHVDWVANERPGCRTGGQCPGRPSSLPCSRCTSRIVFSYCCIRVTKSCQKKYTGASGLWVFKLFKLVWWILEC